MQWPAADLPQFDELRFHELESIELFLPTILDDHASMQLAVAWPRAKSVFLMESKMTLLGLIPFAQSCPRLTELSLPLNACRPPFSQESRPGNGVSSTSLRYLCVGASPVNEPYKVAAFLSGLFPKLEQLAHTGKREPYGKVWDDVEQAVHVFVAVRMQERRATLDFDALGSSH